MLLTLHMWAGGHCVTVTAITQLELPSVTWTLPGLGFGRRGRGACRPSGTVAPVDHYGSRTCGRSQRISTTNMCPSLDDSSQLFYISNNYPYCYI